MATDSNAPFPSPLTQGSFTLPGEAGYEDLTLKLAQRWGADTIRDSDGTQLSDKIITSGYDIYSTICLVRADNAWAKANPDKLQQSYLMSFPVTASGETVTISPLKGYYDQQFQLNLKDDPREWWQVFDRTSGKEVPVGDWSVDASGKVVVRNAVKWHQYTVNFLVYRIWEEISMYNHHTNNWGDREHLMPIDPIHPEAREQMRKYLSRWLAEHPHTKVVRFTSMFYNFFWPWGDGWENYKPKAGGEGGAKFILNDCGSYEFSVSAEAIRQFEKEKGYRPKSEDFVNAGKYWSSHTTPSKVYRDWIDFMHKFVCRHTAEFVKMVHDAGKKAYVFYNDHWLGLEPNMPLFETCKFDGMIDGIFNAFESRKVSATRGVAVKELRLHPYFFPTGVNGAPSFLPGGDPTLECKTYWLDIRRALLRAKIDRIGFGGYLHLVENHPAFVDYVHDLGKEFRMLKSLHDGDKPYQAPLKVAFLTAWGQYRAWLCCGHFNRGNYYNEAMESLAGLPVETTFLSFEDILTHGIPKDIHVLINAGIEGDSWTGGGTDGGYWSNPRVVELLADFVARGGGLIGIGEPSAARFPGAHQHFQLADVLGVDREMGLTVNKSRFEFAPPSSTEGHFILQDGVTDPATNGKEIDGIFLTDPATRVLSTSSAGAGAVAHSSRAGTPRITARTFGTGRAVYLAGHRSSPQSIRLLHRALHWAANQEHTFGLVGTTNPNTEAAYYPAHGKLVVINLTTHDQTTQATCPKGKHTLTVPAYGVRVLEV